MDFTLLAIGIAFLGYFIGDGLKHFGQGKTAPDYVHFLSEKQLPMYINLGKEEIKALLQQPGVPKVELNGKTYYPADAFKEWVMTLGEENR